MGRLAGQTAVITGASSGIGRACMVLFAKEGAKVFGIARTQANLDDTLKEVVDAGGEGAVYSADLSDDSQAAAAIAAAKDELGRIDILLNAAGVGYNIAESQPGSMDPLDTTPTEQWRNVMAINLDSLFYVCRAVLPHMKAQNKGSIVNVASIFGLGGAPNAHTYTATKGAIVNLSRSMSVAYIDDGIRTNVVAPGFVKTNMVEVVLDYLFSDEMANQTSPMKRPATPEEVAYACLYFASDESSYCNGSILAVDGGSTARA